jgi:hypothetical protein
MGVIKGWLGVTVVEMPTFSADARRLPTEAERQEITDRLAYSPEEGVVIQGTGGIRKTRVGLAGRGKRGGGRVMYFYHDADMPLYLIALYAKNEKADLSAKDKALYRTLVQELVKAKKRRRAGGGPQLP